MLRAFRSVHHAAWPLLVLVAVTSAIGLVAVSFNSIEPTPYLYVIQPTVSVLLAILAFVVTQGHGDRARHKAEKATIIASVIAIWFVAYFMSGLLTTYVHNTLTSSLKAVAVNVLAFGITAVAMEYTRYKLMVLAGRRSALAFGLIVAMVFAISQIGLDKLVTIQSADDFVKTTVATIVPAIMTSLLLTYLAVSSGLAAMLTFRLGLLAATILPPIIPKYDWYLIGVSTVLLIVSVYIAIDRNAQGREANRHRHQHRHAKRAYDGMLLIVMIGMVLFMTGMFTYKPSVILSNSMKPIFSRGSVVVLQQIKDALDVKKGDIVQYKSRDHLITHRVVAIELADDGSGQKIYTTKGDNNSSKDPPVRGEQIVGIVRSQIPFLGYPTVWLNEIAG